MKKMLWMLLSAALAMASFVSCSQDETVSSSTEEIESVAAYPEKVDGFSGTRGIVDDSDDFTLIWGPKEAIGVYGSGLTNSQFVSTNKYKNATTAIFSGGSLFKSPKYAYYPYSAENSSSAQTAVKGSLSQLQYYSTTAKKMTGDYKIGKYASRTFTGYKFNFSHVMTFVKFEVNATGTAIEGERVQEVTMTVKSADGQPRQLWGDFTMDLTQSAVNALTMGVPVEGCNVLTLGCLGNVTLSSGASYVGYIAAVPSVEVGDTIEFKVKTDDRTATFTRVSPVNYSANQLVVYDLKLAEVEDLVIDDNKSDVEEDEEDPDGPVLGDMEFTSFKFTVAANPGKILARSFTHNSSFTVSTSTVSEVACVVDNDNHKITLSLPYLNNRKLVPTFEIPENCAVITANMQLVESGVTEIDFNEHKQLAIMNANSEVSIYDIELTNSGLPVVVVNQQTGIGHSETNSKYTAASNAWYAATGTGWLAKDADWEMTEGVDTFMVYNADGTSAVTDKNGAVVESPIDASTRLRGNVTQQMPKKAFAVKLDKKSGVLGMPAHKRWVLLANWKDRTLMRNAVANGIAKVFRDNLEGGIPWNPSGEFVELVYNGVHVGTYYLCEQIKIDGNRLDIADPYDPDEGYSGNPEDYGYLMESDDGYDEAWQFTTANYVPFLLKDDANDDMLTYAAGFVRGIEDQLYAGNYTEAFKKMDLTSFVDFWLIQELMMNSEVAHPKSCYSYINDGVMYAGPLWDFDWNTLPVSSSYSENGYSFTESMLEDAMASSGWFKSYRCFHKKSGYPSAPKNESDGNYIWYPMLVKSAEFKALAAERWNAVKAAVQAYVETEIPKMKTRIAASEALNNKMWPVDSGSTAWSSKRYSTYGIGGGFCGDEAKSFSDAVSTMQSTLKSRINGMSYVSNQSWPNVEYKAE